MATKKTQQEIDEQIKGLIKSKDTLPRHSMFGDDNWGKIDAQISILNGSKVPDWYYVDESAEEYNDGDNDTYFAASDAADWMKGDREENLFDSE